jgi:hypothetical protein
MSEHKTREFDRAMSHHHAYACGYENGYPLRKLLGEVSDESKRYRVGREKVYDPEKGMKEVFKPKDCKDIVTLVPEQNFDIFSHEVLFQHI